MKWPSTSEDEAFQIEKFVESYSRLPERVEFEIVSKTESPDYLVKDQNGREFGIELTSVYMDDRSVPDHHIQETNGHKEIPYDPKAFEQYQKRIIGSIIEKICKARKGYDLRNPLILAIYMNEYISIYLNEPELEKFVDRYRGVFDSMDPFCEIVFWNLGNGGVFRVRGQ
jgi:hypothetical protein